MYEPYLSEFKQMIRNGAACRDIHDSGIPEVDSGIAPADDAFLEREVNRVALHQGSLTPLLERYVGRARRVLDFGCGTGGTTVAMALSDLGVEQMIGIDANPDVVATARVRGAGHGLAPPSLRFEHLTAGSPLPFEDASFDLVVTVSVMEFVTRAADRTAVAAELRRVVAPGGYLYIATPRPGLREYHTGELFGDLRRASGHSWSSTPLEVASWGANWRHISVSDHLAAQVTRRVPWLSERVVAGALGPILPHVGRWQKMLWQRPAK